MNEIMYQFGALFICWDLDFPFKRLLLFKLLALSFYIILYFNIYQTINLLFGAKLIEEISLR